LASGWTATRVRKHWLAILERLPVIGVNFPKFTDGRSYSSARLLRERYRYHGEIRALGDVLQDQLFYMRRCGIDAYALRADKDIDKALAGLAVFSDTYQAAVDQPQPLFRRRATWQEAGMSTLAISTTRPCSTRWRARSSTHARLLREIADDFSPAAFASSLGAEDMVLTDLIVSDRLDIEIFSLDTGRLPAETYALIAKVKSHYGLALHLYYPRHDLAEAWTREHGINAFYESVELRKGCCHFRKVEPLQRALTGRKAWITGMRAQQAATREALPMRSFDAASGGLEKFNPLTAWSEREVWAYLKLTRCPTTRCTTSSTRASAARRARGDLTGRRRPRRPLVVGESRIEGMRLARQARLKPGHQTNASNRASNHTGQP
jgi:phosphoadenosine phosphosulfate reductase